MRERLRVSGAAPRVDQSAFYTDRHQIANPGRLRLETGRFFEEASRLLFNALPHQIDATADYCPDLSLPDRVFIEVKAIGNSRQAIIYQKRLEKDRKLQADESTIFYAFWIHHVPVKGITHREDLHQVLATGTDRLLIVPFRRINGFLRGKKPTGTLRHPDGTLRDHFHRIAMGDLMRLTNGHCRHAHGRSFEIPGPAPFGHPMPPLTVYGNSLEHVIQLSSREIELAGEMVHQLSVEKLEVALMRAPRPQYIGHKIRVVSNCNPDWYRALAASLPSHRRRPRRGRKTDTDLQRYRVVRALERLADGRCDTAWTWRMRVLVRQCGGLPAIGH